MNKIEAIKALGGALGPDDLVVCCNGMIGRELYGHGSAEVVADDVGAGKAEVGAESV